MGTDSGGVSRRRVLIGTAWATPAIVMAVGVPRAAASGPGECYDFTQILQPPPKAEWAAEFWDASTSQNVPAVFFQSNLQFQRTYIEGCTPPSTMVGFTLKYTIPVGDIAAPAWGLNSNSEQIPSTVPFEIAVPLAVNNGVATLTLRYTGPALTVWQSVQPWLWMQTDAVSKVGIEANDYAIATFDNGSVTSSSLTVQIVAAATNYGGAPLTDWPSGGPEDHDPPESGS